MPLILSLVALILLAMFIKYRRLKLMRLQCFPVFSPEIAATLGGFAAGAENYSFSADVFPFLLPTSISRCWRTEADGMICGQIFAWILFICAIILMPIGMYTWSVGKSSFSIIRDTNELTTIGFSLACIGGVLCVLICCFRSVGYRQRRWAMNQQILLQSQPQYAQPQIQYGLLEQPQQPQFQQVHQQQQQPIQYIHQQQQYIGIQMPDGRAPNEIANEQGIPFAQRI